MSVTIVHRPYVQVRWLPIVVVLTVAVAAALVVVLSIQASTTTPAATSAETIGAAVAPAWTADVPKNRSPAFRAVVSGQTPAAVRADAPAPPAKSSHTYWLTGDGVIPSR